MEASTSKRLPRNRLRVLAFAGDSTMIRPSATGFYLLAHTAACSAAVHFNVPGTLPAHSSFQLQPAETGHDLGKAQAQPASQLARLDRQDIGEMAQHSVSTGRRGNPDAEAGRRPERIVEDLPR